MRHLVSKLVIAVPVVVIVVVVIIIVVVVVVVSVVVVVLYNERWTFAFNTGSKMLPMERNMPPLSTESGASRFLAIG